MDQINDINNVNTIDTNKFSEKGRLLKEDKKTGNMAVYRHNWYIQNRDKCLKIMGRDVLCKCGLTIKYSNLCKHVRTNKHQYFLTLLKANEEV